LTLGDWNDIIIIMTDGVYSIAEISKNLSPIIRRYGLGETFVFGSYARGEATPQSDVDICIEKGRVRTLFELSGVRLDFEDALRKRVDLVTTDSLRGAFKAEVERERVELHA
jgi:hypothetical protein